jgi:mannan endo-1,4-beta-mannosidase
MIKFSIRINLAFLNTFLCLLFFYSSLISQSFIRVNNTDLYSGNNKFYFIGGNAYYCASKAALGDTNSILEIFSEMKMNNMNVLRILGFYDSDDSTNPAVIQYKPGVYNEKALQAMDHVIWKAAEYNLKVIISLVNNWEDYGGMNQYVKWYSKFLGMKDLTSNKRILIRKSGNSDKFYNYFITDNLTHDDFYTNTKIKEWYKHYTEMIINRVNTRTLISYKNDPAIFSWELANEPESSDRSGKITHDWIKEMSAFIKSIDSNHMVGTGEEGFDVDRKNYSAVYLNYNSQEWIFNGIKGIGFYENTGLKNIDYGCAHLYNEGWNFNDISGNVWIQDHKNICNLFNKPFILGEFGTRNDKPATYKKWLNTVLLSSTNGALVWSLGYDSMPDYDGYTVYYPLDQSLFQMFSFYSLRMNSLDQINSSREITLPFPNPCNEQVNFIISLDKTTVISISIYNILGEEVTSSVEYGYPNGISYKSINTKSLSNGIYIVKFRYDGKSCWRKFCVVK